MPEVPRITALLPVKNYDPVFLRRALDSMFGQSSPRWRLIVICEPPDLEHFTSLLLPDLEDSRVRLMANEGRGLAGALNTGLRAAQTEFCGILLGDDMWTGRAVEVLESEIANHPEVDFFHSAREKVDEEDRPIGPPLYGREEVRPEDFRRSAPLKHLLCFRRTMALEIGGVDESFQVLGPDDYDFPWSMAQHGAAFRAIPEVLYSYREHRRFGRLSTDAPRRERWRELVRMWRKHGAGGLRGRAQALWAGRDALRKGLRRADRPSRAPLGPRPRSKR